MFSVRWVGSLLVLSILLSACGSSSSTTSENSKSGITSDQIIVDELSFPADGLSAFQLINQYKPQWLRKRGQSSFNNPVPVKVYLNNSGSAAGSVSYLRNLRVVNIASIQHFDAQEAQFRFGLDNTSGAILVQMKGAGE